MSTFPHLLPYNLHATGQFRCFFRFQFRTRILTDLHIVRYSLSPVTSTRITIVQKLLRRNQQATFKIFTDPIKLECMQVIREKMRERTHFYQKELVQNAFIGFLLDLGNIMLSKKDRLIRPPLSRKEELFEQFLQLLFEHCKEQHVVTFYAEKLFITPQYLSLILKELTGKSANKWIDDALIVEAKVLLKAPQATVQQVADILHFSDQSTFGKFFKKHMGISPMEYRKS